MKHILFWWIVKIDGKTRIFAKKTHALNAQRDAFYRDHHQETGKKKYVLSLALIEDGKVVYTRESVEVTASNRLEAIQLLRDQNSDMWKSIMETFHVIHNKVTSREGSEKKG